MSSTSRKPRKFGFLPFLFCLFGLVFLGIGISQMWGNLKTASWPRTEGVIEQSTVVSRWEHGSSGSTRMYYPKVVFRYQVDGISHVSDHIYLHGPGGVSVRSLVLGTVSEFPVGRKVEIAYDPDDPATAVLKPGGVGDAWIPALIGAGFFIVGILVWKYSGRGMKHTTRPGPPRTLPTRPAPVPEGRSPTNSAAAFPVEAIRRIAKLVNGIAVLAFLGYFGYFFWQAPTKPGEGKPQQAVSSQSAPQDPNPEAPTAHADTDPFPTGHRVVVQTVPPVQRTRPKPVSEAVRAFLAKIEREPSPCPALLATTGQRIAQDDTDLNDLFQRLEKCKWRRESYAEAKETGVLWRHHYIDPWPEEQAIRKVIRALAERVQPTEGTRIYEVPQGTPPLVDGRLGGDEWNDALVFAPAGTRTRIFVKTDGVFLYLGAVVPENTAAHNYNSLRLLLHAHISPHIKHEYFFIYNYGNASVGYRPTRLQPDDAPKVKNWREQNELPPRIRWKSYEVNDHGVFPSPRSGSLFDGRQRTYEVAVDLNEALIPKGLPFSLGAVIEIAPNGRSRRYVWPFQEDHATDNSLWEVWLKIPDLDTVSGFRTSS